MGRAERWVAAAGLAGALALGGAPMRASACAAAQDASERGAAARVVTDEVGRRVEAPREVRRIVTLAPDLTETIYALGLEERLVGDTDFCDMPAAAKSKPHVGPPVKPNLEAIVGLHPDLVLATTSINRRDFVDALERMGIAVYATDPHTVPGMIESIRHVADLLGAGEAGAEVAGRLQGRLDALESKLQERPPVHVLFVVWDEPLISIGQNTFIADALRWAGAESIIVSKVNWPQVSVEEVLRLQPDYIVVASDHSESGAGKELEKLRARPAWKELSAVRAGRVVTVGEEATRPSAGLVDTIEELARELHPEVFDKPENRNGKTGNGAAHGEIALLTGCDGCGR